MNFSEIQAKLNEPLPPTPEFRPHEPDPLLSGAEMEEIAALIITVADRLLREHSDTLDKLGDD